MKAKVIETGEIVNVTPYPTIYQEKGQGPDRREWYEDELEFEPGHKIVSLDKVCEYLKGLTYQEYPGGPMERMISDEFIEGLKKNLNNENIICQANEDN